MNILAFLLLSLVGIGGTIYLATAQNPWAFALFLFSLACAGMACFIATEG